MSGHDEKRDALRFVEGLENGTVSAQDAWSIAGRIDPVLVYFALRFLREKHPASKPQSAGVTQRIVDLTSTYADVVAKAKKGEGDVIREWFDDTYEVRDFFAKPSDLVNLLVEKIEG